ncbi:hypothetical protein BY996DRAFT_6619996 [Phakopsora pachyrhizi]|nr:hypothetical protein BY996DRAFT_6619996 [Phakopsora pachyrhizi]
MVRSLFEQAKKLGFKPKNNEIEFNRMKNKPFTNFDKSKKELGLGIQLIGSLKWDPDGRYVTSIGFMWLTFVEPGYAIQDFKGEQRKPKSDSITESTQPLLMITPLKEMDLLAGVMDGVVAWIAVVVIDGQILKWGELMEGYQQPGPSFTITPTGVCVWPTKDETSRDKFLLRLLEDKRTEEQRIEDREDIGLQEKEAKKIVDIGVKKSPIKARIKSLYVPTFKL